VKTTQRIRAKFGLFRAQGLFLDCTLKAPTHDILCHRLVLSRYSRYFSRLFLVPCDRVIPITFDPTGLLSSVVDFLYTSELAVTADRLPALAAIASYYEMPDLSTLLLDVLACRLTFENVLGLLQGMVTAGLTEYIKVLLPFIAANFRRFSQADLFQCATPRVFGQILTDPQFPADFNAPARLGVIDSFCETTESLSDDARALLSLAINFEEAGAHACMLNFRCDWLPYRSQRTFLNIILTERRASLHAWEKDQAAVGPAVVGRWCVLQWLASIAQAEAMAEVDSIRFIGTFGGLSEFIDPVRYRLIDMASSPPIARYFGAEAFGGLGAYFASMRIGDGLPWVEFEFGESERFRLTGIAFEMPAVDPWKPPRPFPGPVRVAVAGASEMPFECRGTNERAIVEAPEPGHGVRMVMVGETSSGGWIFRFAFVQMWGTFAA
jgi:hypothetical protein